MLTAWMVNKTFGQPFFISGEANVEFTGGFSYDFLRSPLERPFDHSMGKVSVNVPFNVSKPLHSILDKATQGSISIPKFSTQLQQGLSTSIDISSPFLNGAFFFAIRENAAMLIRGSIGNSEINIAENKDGTDFKLRGSINVPLVFQSYWRTLTFGYTLAPTPLVRIGLQFHNHMAGASTAGKVNTNFNGRLINNGNGQIVTINIEYPEQQVYGNIEGNYHGEAWSPEIALKIGPIFLNSRMGVELKADGYLISESSLPFFIDDEKYNLKYTDIDSFLTAENLPKLLNSEVNRKSYQVKDGLVLKVPQSHTLGIHIIPEKLSLYYTKTFGSLESFLHNDSFKSDSNSRKSSDILNSELYMDNILIANLNFNWFRANVGASNFNVSYKDSKNILNKYIPLEIFDHPILPILNFGFEFGKKNIVGLDFYISPMPAVRTGFEYVF